MFCLAANYNAPHNNTPMLGVHAREVRLARAFEVDDRWFRLGDHGRYAASNEPIGCLDGSSSKRAA